MSDSDEAMKALAGLKPLRDFGFTKFYREPSEPIIIGLVAQGQSVALVFELSGTSFNFFAQIQGEPQGWDMFGRYIPLWMMVEKNDLVENLPSEGIRNALIKEVARRQAKGIYKR